MGHTLHSRTASQHQTLYWSKIVQKIACAICDFRNDPIAHIVYISYRIFSLIDLIRWKLWFIPDQSGSRLDQIGIRRSKMLHSCCRILSMFFNITVCSTVMEYGFSHNPPFRTGLKVPSTTVSCRARQHLFIFVYISHIIRPRMIHLELFQL